MMIAKAIILLLFHCQIIWATESQDFLGGSSSQTLTTRTNHSGNRVVSRKRRRGYSTDRNEQTINEQTITASLDRLKTTQTAAKSLSPLIRAIKTAPSSAIVTENFKIIPMEERFRAPLFIACEKSFYDTGVPLTEFEAAKILNPSGSQMLVLSPQGLGILTYRVVGDSVTMHGFALPNARSSGLLYLVFQAICQHPYFCDRPIKVNAKKSTRSLGVLLKLGLSQAFLLQGIHLMTFQ